MHIVSHQSDCYHATVRACRREKEEVAAEADEVQSSLPVNDAEMHPSWHMLSTNRPPTKRLLCRKIKSAKSVLSSDIIYSEDLPLELLHTKLLASPC